MRLFLAATIVAGCCSCGLAGADEVSDRIAKLIVELDSDEFAVREAAGKALTEIGEPAAKAIEDAAKNSPSAEVRTRAAGVMKTFELARLRKNALKLEQILALTRVKDGKPDAERVDALVGRLVETLNTESGRKDLKPPVVAKDCGVGGGAERGASGFPRLGLVAQKAATHPFAEESVFLFDTAGSVSHLKNSIVIARIAVNVSHAENCIILAGELADVSFATNCIVLCGGDTTVAHAKNSVLGGRRGLSVSHSDSGVYVNSPAIPAARIIAGRAPTIAVEVNGLVLGERDFVNPLAGKVELSHVTANGFILFKLPGARGEYVARTDQELSAPDGGALPNLAGWKLAHVGDKFALVTKGEEEALLRMTK